MSVPDSSPQRAAEIAEQSNDVEIVSSVENGVHTISAAMTIGGYALSVVKPEIGYTMMGTGFGLIVGTLAVGYALRHGNG